MNIEKPISGIEAFAAANDALYPRSASDFERFANDGQLWCAILDNEFAGLTYSNLDLTAREWEIGGLMVDTRHWGKRIGSTLMRLTLGHLLFSEDPVKLGHNVVAHVHKENSKPRPIIEQCLKFKYAKSIKVHGSLLSGLRADSEGYVHGDEYHMSHLETLNALASWCESFNTASMNESMTEIQLMPRITLADWALAFRSRILKVVS